MIRLKPVFKEKIWGSTHLEPLFNNSQSKIGEIWFEGFDNLPLLVKFLFTTEKLSIQVHPDDDYARIHHNSPGKTEMWHVLAAEPGAQIAAGFREPITAERLREASVSGEIESLLAWFDAAPGDTFYIPAGTVHAIGGGLTLCEIQQYSDVTYRLHDYGRARDLHIDQGLQVSHLGTCPARQKRHENSVNEVLASGPYFTTSRLCISNVKQHILRLNTRDLLIMIEGSGAINGQSTKAGDVWYLEAAVEKTVFSGDGVFLQIHPN